MGKTVLLGSRRGWFESSFLNRDHGTVVARPICNGEVKVRFLVVPGGPLV